MYKYNKIKMMQNVN